MALQYSTAVRNAQLDAVESAIGTAPKLQLRTGAPPANCAAADSGTLLCEMILPSDWMDKSAAGAADCAIGLAAIDLAGNCRATPQATMGALEAVAATTTEPTPTPAPIPKTPAPGTVKTVTIPTSLLREIFSDGSARTVTGTDHWGHCIGRQKDKLCRATMTFPTAAIPKGTIITKLQLRLNVVYSSAPNPYTWAISRYGTIGDDPGTDQPATALVRADGQRYLNASASLRTTGQKIIFITKAINDLTVATIAGKPFSLGIKQNQENPPDKFTALGQTDAQRPQLLVTVKYP